MSAGAAGRAWVGTGRDGASGLTGSGAVVVGSGEEVAGEAGSCASAEETAKAAARLTSGNRR